MRKERIWEIDLLRGIAFLCMVYDHAVYDINYIFGYKTNVLWGYDHLIGDFSAILFMLLCGISCHLSKDPMRNGLKVFGIACCLTVVTGMIDHFLNMGLIINFGILHMLGIAMMVCGLVRKLSSLKILGISALILVFRGVFTTFFKFNDLYWLFPLGIYTGAFYSSDYYPLSPYVGVVLLGLIIGKLLYKEKRSLFPFSISGKDPFSVIGRHSLMLYVIHQPILLVILYAVIWLLDITGLI